MNGKEQPKTYKEMFPPMEFGAGVYTFLEACANKDGDQFKLLLTFGLEKESEDYKKRQELLDKLNKISKNMTPRGAYGLLVEEQDKLAYRRLSLIFDTITVHSNKVEMDKTNI